MATCELTIKGSDDDVDVKIDGNGVDLIKAIATVLYENEDIRNLVVMALLFATKEEINNNKENDNESRTIN